MPRYSVVFDVDHAPWDGNVDADKVGHGAPNTADCGAGCRIDWNRQDTYRATGALRDVLHSAAARGNESAGSR